MTDLDVRPEDEQAPEPKRSRGGLLHRLYHGETHFDFVGKRRIGFAISGILILVSLLSLFTHNHLYWVIGLFLAMIDLPDFGTPLRRIAGSVEKMAGVPPEQDPTEPPVGDDAHTASTDEAKARQIAEEAMKIAGKICIYTNDKITIEEL